MRKIFSFLMAAVLSISTAFATTVYCKVTQSWWTQDGAAVGVHYWGGASAGTAWPGVRMTPVSGEEGTWTYDVPEDVTGLIFTRVNGSGDIADWGAKTTNLSLPTDGKNLYTITSETGVWGEPGVTGEWSVYAGEGGEEEMDTVYTWYGKRGDTSATEAIEKGGTAAAYGGNSNIVVGTSQKTNWTIKLNKGFSNANFVGITLDKALEAGDKLQVAAFRTSASDAIFGIDFSEDAEQAATTCQILFPNNLQQISSNVAPEDTIFTVPDCAVGAKFIRIYRNSGSTGIYVANFTVLREKGGDTPEPPVAAKFYVTGDSALVTDAGFAGKAWNPDAIKAEADTLVMNLKAETDYILKVTVNGTWEGENNVKGYNELTEKTAGLKDLSDDHNIGFRLAEAGEVKVVYIAAEGENQEIFKLIGNFYVEPTPVPAKFYVTGNDALVGEELAWNPSAIKSMNDTLVLNLEAETDYILKVTVNGTWEGENNVKGYNELTEKTAGLLDLSDDHNIGFKLAEAGEVKVVYIAAEGENQEIFKLIGNFYVEPTPEPAKFYVTGNDALVGEELAWNPSAVKSMNDTLVLNLEAETDYVLKVTVNGTWEGENNVKGYNELTEKTAGLKDLSDDHNIGFKLAEAGEVKVVYIAAEGENSEIFKLIGNFYVEPTPEPAKFYVTGNDALVGEELAWNPSAIKSMNDTLVLNLEAETDYILKVTVNGTWEGENNVKGYNELTEKTAGLKDLSDDHNIGFRLAEAGEVKVVYIAAEGENQEIFKLIGNFYVDPTPVVPTAAVTGDMTEWGEPIPFELSEDSTFATLYNDNIKKGTYAFKMIINGDWRSNGYEFHRGFPGCAGITGNTEANMTVVIDVEGAYTFKWYFANDSLAIIYPEKPEPVLTNGYYLVGKFGGVDAWDPVAANLFAANPDTEGEYQLSIDLAVDDEIKVVYVAEDEITTWYPKEGNYIVDDHHNGPTTMYFRPEYNSDWSAFGGYFYIVPTSTVGFENTAADTKAVKVLKNGILVIEKNNKTYNVMGQMVK